MVFWFNVYLFLSLQQIWLWSCNAHYYGFYCGLWLVKVYTAICLEHIAMFELIWCIGDASYRYADGFSLPWIMMLFMQVGWLSQRPLLISRFVHLFGWIATMLMCLTWVLNIMLRLGLAITDSGSILVQAWNRVLSTIVRMQCY